jgi:Cu(I)/Ag(I) efflux system membrane protein CusA/SilA
VVTISRRIVARDRAVRAQSGPDAARGRGGVRVGVFALRHTPLDAIPDLSDVQVIVWAEWPGRGPDLVEDQITTRSRRALLSAPRVHSVRGQSFFGLSLVYVIFEDGTISTGRAAACSSTWMRPKARLPRDVTPTIGPDATGVGWVFEYALVDRSGSTTSRSCAVSRTGTCAMRSRACPASPKWRRSAGSCASTRCRSIPSDCAPTACRCATSCAAVRSANYESGGGVLEIAGHEQVIRGRGYVRDLADLELVPLRAGERGRRSTAGRGDDRVRPDMRRGWSSSTARASGRRIVVMRWGENALAVIDAVKERLESVRRRSARRRRDRHHVRPLGLIRAAIGTLRTRSSRRCSSSRS